MAGSLQGFSSGTAGIPLLTRDVPIEGPMQDPTRGPVKESRVPKTTLLPPAQPEEREVKSQQDHRKTIPMILVLGRSECGKTSLIDTAACATEERFKLVNAPDVDSQTMSNLEAFTMLADYLIDGTRIEAGVIGVVYIHCATDPLESRALSQYMHVLSEVFLGEAGLPRLTILVVPSKFGAPNSVSSVGRALSRARAFHAAYAGGAKTVDASIAQEGFGRVLTSYASKNPVRLRIQQEHLRDPQDDVIAQIEVRLGYYEKDSVQLRLDEQAKQHQHHYQTEIKKLQSSLHESQSSALQFSEEAAKLRANAASLHQQLYHTRGEYASLRSQFQLQENIEQSEIVQGLKDLNREIDEIGRSISAYLADTHVRAVFHKDPGEITALHARHLPELQVLFGDNSKASTLIATSSGTGMPVEDFFDYATRHLLCLSLSKRIFGPFHPGVDASKGDVVSAMYEGIRRQEPQAVAAKWRANSFKNVYKPNEPDAIARRVNVITQKFVAGTLGRLITAFFGQEAKVVLEKQHVDRLERLVRMAWDWNSMLKGDVLVLGDFHPTIYNPWSGFDPAVMSEFESNPQRSQQKFILATLALGLTSSHAIGGGEPPERSVVYRAVVATRNLYE